MNTSETTASTGAGHEAVLTTTPTSRIAGYTPVVRWVLVALRLSLGWVFLWAFLDKTFGLGFATPSDRAWVSGGSPTTGFLESREGTFSGAFTPLAGQAWADWLFQIGLLGIGLALVLGMGMRIAAVAGSLLLVLMWLAELPLVNNPFMNDHLVYSLVLVLLAASHAGDAFGLGKTWSRTSLVRSAPILR